MVIGLREGTVCCNCWRIKLIGAGPASQGAGQAHATVATGTETTRGAGAPLGLGCLLGGCACATRKLSGSVRNKALWEGASGEDCLLGAQRIFSPSCCLFLRLPPLLSLALALAPTPILFHPSLQQADLSTDCLRLRRPPTASDRLRRLRHPRRRLRCFSPAATRFLSPHSLRRTLRRNTRHVYRLHVRRAHVPQGGRGL